MKIRNIACAASLLFATLSAAQAQVTQTITAWNFDNIAISQTNNPIASTGSGTANAIGMTTSLTPTPSVSNPDVQSLAGSSTGGANCWRIRGKGTTPNTGNGWDSAAALGTQGAEFDVSTVGYTNIQVSLDINATTQGEQKFQLQFTPDGTHWYNITNLSLGSGSTVVLATNTTSANTVYGTYGKLQSTANAGWNNSIMANLASLTNVSLSVNQNPSFGIRVVNAATGADCVAAAGTALNNTSGNWSLDNIVITGTTQVLPLPLGPVLTADPNNITVNSNSFTVTFPSGNSAWVSAITNISVGGTNLYTTAHNYGITIGAASISFNMTSNAVYQVAGSLHITVSASGYIDDSVSQTIVLPAGPMLTAAANVTVDSNSFAISFPSGNSAWVSAITNISVGTTNLYTLSHNYGITFGSTNISFNTTAAAVFRKSGSLNIVVVASGYNSDSVSQYIAPGAAVNLAITTQPAGPTGDGGTLVAQPALSYLDQFSNVATNATATFTASVNPGWWSFGPGSGLSVAMVNGTVNFTNLSVSSPKAVTGAVITFTASGSGLPAINTTNSTGFNIPAPRSTGFTSGNLTVLQEDLVNKNSTMSIIELSPSITGQSAPVNVYPVPATETNALRQASSGSTGRLANTDDGTFVSFAGAQINDGSLVSTPDVTAVNARGAGTFDANGNYTLQATYTGLGVYLGTNISNQARSAVSVDNLTWYMGDKGGIYTNGQADYNSYIQYQVYNGIGQGNVRSLRSFGGTVYALQQEGGTQTNVIILSTVPDPSSGSQAMFPLEGFPIDGYTTDFYLLCSGANGSIYDTCYYIDGTNATTGAIFKYYYTGVNDPYTSQQIWAPAGSWACTNSGDALCAATNPVTGGYDIYITTGNGGVAGNSVKRIHDSSAWNSTINVISTNILYTVSSNSTLKGISFAPVAASGSPVVVALTASNLTTTAATLAASVNPNGTAAGYWFNYGPTTDYGSVTPTNALAAGSSPVIVTSALTGLLPGTIYHYQIVASNSVATSPGIDMTFIAPSPLITPYSITESPQVTGGVAAFSFTNGIGLTFSVHATNNLSAPLATWPVIGSPVEILPGSYQFNDPNPATNSSLFYIISQP